MFTNPGPGPTCGEQAAKETISLSHDYADRKKKLNFPGHKGSSEYHKKRNSDHEKNSNFTLPLLANQA